VYNKTPNELKPFIYRGILAAVFQYINRDPVRIIFSVKNKPAEVSIAKQAATKRFASISFPKYWNE